MKIRYWKPSRCPAIGRGALLLLAVPLLLGAMPSRPLLEDAAALPARPAGGPDHGWALAATLPKGESRLGDVKVDPNSLITRTMRPAVGIHPSAMFGEPSGFASPWWWLLPLVTALLAFPACWWVLSRPRRVYRTTDSGFEVISPGERRRFIPLREKFQHLDFVSQYESDQPLRLSANLNKVSLSARRFGYLLEDKNFRNALLVNRRRIRRTLLKNGDVLDLGDLTLLYRDTRATGVTRYSAVTPRDGKTLVKFKRHRGPIRKGTPVLTSEQYPNRVFYMTNNLIFIGRSEENDLVVKSQSIHYRHAKIERVGGRFKLLDLGMTGNTFVNNRRIEQRYLRDGDMITLDKQRFRFSIVDRPIRERPNSGDNAVARGDQGYGPSHGEKAPAV